MKITTEHRILLLGRCLLLTLLISCFLSGIFPSSAVSAPKIPVQIRVNVNKVAVADLPQQVETLRYLQRLFVDNHVLAGFWFSGGAYQQIKEREPSLPADLHAAGFVIAHHGANRGGQNSLVERTASLPWEQVVQTTLDFERQADRGGLAQMQQDFANGILVTGRFFRAPILEATKQLGCQVMIGLKEQLGAPTNAAWYMGMMNLPDGIIISPEEIRTLGQTSHSVEEHLDRLIQQLPSGAPLETVSILVHDLDFLKGSTDAQSRFRAAYSELIVSIASDARFKSVTYRELLQQVVDPKSQALTGEQLLVAAKQLLALGHVPLFFSLGDSAYSAADIFYALANSLLHYTAHDRFPTTIMSLDLLGPILIPAQNKPFQVETSSLLAALRVWLSQPGKSIPASLRVADQEISASSLMFAMADLLVEAYSAKRFPALIKIPSISIFPAQTANCPDSLSRLQFWTYRPQILRVLPPDVPEDNSAKKPKQVPHGHATPVYVTIYSHNEEDGPWALLEEQPEQYARYRANLIKKVRLIRAQGAVLSWQSDHSVLRAMRRHEQGELLRETNNKNILRWMVEDMGVEVTPHGHLSRYNYADLIHLFKQLGVTPAPVVGGFALFECTQGSDKPYSLRNWTKELELRPDGYISGRIYRDETWQPKILVQPAMVGHVFDEFSSGVWLTDPRGSFLEHEPGGGLLVIGQGYPHYTEHLGGGKRKGVRAASLQYIRELVDKIAVEPGMSGKIFTASILTSDYPTKGEVDTYAALQGTLAELAPLVQSRQVILKSYSEIAKIWETTYRSVPNRYPIEHSILYPLLEADLRTHCQEQAGMPGDALGANRTKCGDGVCDELERSKGACPRDCQSVDGTDVQPGSTILSGSDRSPKPAVEKQAGMPGDALGVNRAKCGDGVCDELERSKGACPRDCQSVDGADVQPGSAIPSGSDRSPGPTAENLRRCGDNHCDDFERRSGKCVQDCQ